MVTEPAAAPRTHVADWDWDETACCYYIRFVNGVVIKTARSDIWDRLIMLIKHMQSGDIKVTTEVN